MRKRTIELPPNPFEGKNHDEVWKSLLAQSVPISREVALAKMKTASEIQMKNKDLNP